MIIIYVPNLRLQFTFIGEEEEEEKEEMGITEKSRPWPAPAKGCQKGQQAARRMTELLYFFLQILIKTSKF